MITSNLCPHTDPRGRYYYRVDCPTCTPMRYRCVYCYQAARKERWVATKCMTGRDHVAAVEGFGSLCSVCGLAVFEQLGGKKTECTLSSGHVLAVYPFRCEVCKGSVCLERPSICEESFNAQHLLPSGYVDMGLVRSKPQGRDAAYDAEIKGYLRLLKSKRLTRRFV